MNPILGFAPDADQTTKGILTDCENFIPYESGFRGAPTLVVAPLSVLPGSCRGAAVVTRLNGGRRIFAGTQAAIYELVGNSWPSRTAALVINGGPESRWSYCQFGDTTIASNLADAMLSSATGDFTAIATAPKAKIVVSASNNFVIAFNTIDGAYGTSPDRWWCCAQSDQTNWTPNVATLATTGRLVAVEGPIQAALPLGDSVIAYKQRGIFAGSFVGSPVVFQWNLIPSGDAGCVGQDAVCDIGGAHFIVGNDDFWLFDGTRPVPIGSGVIRQWFLVDSSPAFRFRTQVAFDRQNNLVRVHYASNASGGVLDSCLVYHILKKQWGRSNLTIQATLQYIGSGVTFDTWSTVAATFDTLPGIAFDSSFWTAGGQVASVFGPGTTSFLLTLTGACAASSFTTHDMGDDYAVTSIESFRVRYEKRPTTAAATGYFKFNEGDTLTTGPTSAINDGKFDLRQTGRFHRVKVSMTGDNRVYAYDGKPIPVGAR